MAVFVLLAAGVHGHPANPQQIPPKVFDIRNGTTATVAFNVLANAQDALSRRNAASLATTKSGTFSCGFSTCYVAFQSGGKTLTRRVYGAKKYAFSISGGKLDLFATSS